jgi:phosphotransacetylase
MPLETFEQLFQQADARLAPVAVAAAGGDDPSVLAALGQARDRGWVVPIVVGPEAAIRAEAEAAGVDLHGFTIVAAEVEAAGVAAVAEVRAGRARMLMKGQIPTPSLLRAILDSECGLRTGQVVCQVVLMEIPRDGRRFLMADTGICVDPPVEQRIQIIEHTTVMAHKLGAAKPRVALMAASEKVNAQMPETFEAAELQLRHERGEFADCVLQGPLSFDLAYAVEAAGKKRVKGKVVGAADVMIFPNLLSANLTVKAIMYAADSRFGGVLCGTSAPVVFMSRADTAATRLNSLALALTQIDGR